MSYWNDRYATDDYLFGTEPASPLVAVRKALPSAGHALSVADGEGRNSVWLARQGFEVTAFDFSENALAKARKLADGAGVTVDFRFGDITRWDWDERPYDLVTGIFFQFLSPVPRAAVFAGMAKALRPGGMIYILGYRPENIGRGSGGPQVEEQLYTEALLRDSFGDLTIERLRSWDEVLAEGRGHRGSAALVELLARKPE